MSNNPDLGILLLLPSVLAGDTLMEEEFFSLLRARFYSLVRYKVWDPNEDPVQMQQDVDDVVQDIMLVIVEKIRNRSFSQDDFFPVSFGIAHNKIKDYYKKKKGKQRREQLDEAQVDLAAVPEDELEIKLSLERIKEACKKLHPRDQEIIRALMNGAIKEYIKTKSRIILKSTIYAHISRARQRLKELIGPEGLQ